MNVFNKKQIYYAMFYAIDEEAEKTQDDWLINFAAVMSPFVFVPDETVSADSSIYADFLICYEEHFIPENNVYRESYELFWHFLTFYKDIFHLHVDRIRAHVTMNKWIWGLDQVGCMYPAL